MSLLKAAIMVISAGRLPTCLHNITMHVRAARILLARNRVSLPLRARGGGAVH